jgi:hypothetical protein
VAIKASIGTFSSCTLCLFPDKHRQPEVNALLRPLVPSPLLAQFDIPTGRACVGQIVDPQATRALGEAELRRSRPMAKMHSFAVTGPLWYAIAGANQGRGQRAGGRRRETRGAALVSKSRSRSTTRRSAWTTANHPGSGQALAIIVPTAIVRPAAASAMLVPKLIADAGKEASLRFLDFFTANIRNPNTRAAYAVASFLSAAPKERSFNRWPDSVGIRSGSCRR